MRNKFCLRSKCIGKCEIDQKCAITFFHALFSVSVVIAFQKMERSIAESVILNDGMYDVVFGFICSSKKDIVSLRGG